MGKQVLGKVFISHSSVDKRFVRRLARAIEKKGFGIWLDERELVAGDSLAKKVSEAIDSARVVLVVVSRSSVKSSWLAFELNKATNRMVKGECRVIPAVIERVELPPEVGGLLYADFTSNFKLGLRALITALESEVSTLEHNARRNAIRGGFWSRVKLALSDIFGPTAYASVMGEYKSIDYTVVSLPIPNGNGDETGVVYETVSHYGTQVKPLSDRWWIEFEQSIQDIPEKLFLVVTERPIGFTTETNHSNEPLLTVKPIFDWKKNISAYVVFADLSRVGWRRQCSILKHARNLLSSLAKQFCSSEAVASR
jgi:hypothetical protein